MIALTIGVAGGVSASEMRVRIAWGGGAARLWRGQVSARDGALSNPRPLGIEADEPGSMWIENGRLAVRQRSPRTYDGVDLVVDGSPEGTIVVDLTADAEGGSKTIEIPLKDILGGFFNVALDERGNRLLVRRAPDDMLRVALKHRSLVFSPGETLRFDLQPFLLPVESGAKLRLHVALCPARSSQALWTKEQFLDAGQASPLPQEIVLPREEGVYDIVIRALPAGVLRFPNAVASSLNWSRQPVAQRRIQVVVLSPQSSAEAADAAASPEEIVEIDPANPRWWDRLTALPQWRRGPRLVKGPLGNGRLHTRRHPLGELAELAPRSSSDDVSWEAYTLPIDQPGKPHVVEVDYPSDVPQTMGISIVEPNDAGALYPLGLDSGVELTEEVTGSQEPARWLRHRLVFWPRTRWPMVLITNRRDQSPAVYGKIRVTALGDHLPRPFPPPGPSERLLAGYMDKPLFPENFSANDSIAAMSDLGVDDWVTFYQSGTRLAEYLHYAGMNGLMLSALSDGSTIYPSDLVEPTPRYDTGTFLDTAQDPVRKDILEMLLRIFDRQGLRMIPALDFAAPLPELEAVLRAGGAEREGMQWIGAQGRAWTEVSSPVRAKAPYYNVLHPRVQTAMLAVVRELASRYADHPSFHGLALQLSAHGYAQLPGPEWGMDDVTVGRFQRDTGVALAGSGPDRFAQRARALAGEHSQQWLQWRAEQLAAFYFRLAAEVQAVKPGCRLYLCGADMFSGEDLQRHLKPALNRRPTMAETLLRVGIDVRLFGADGPVLLRSESLEPRWSLAKEAVALELRQMPDADECFSAMPTSGSLFFHRPQETRLASFDEQSPFKSSYTWLATHAVPSDHQNRRRFVHAMAALDSHVLLDGGWQLPLGQEPSLRGFAAAYRKLPPVRFADLPEGNNKKSSQPVTVRYAVHEGQTYVYLANDAPFPTHARLPLDASPDCRIEELSGMRTLAPLKKSAAGSELELTLEPYDFVALRVNSPHVRLARAEVAWPPEAEEAIAARINDLEQRAATLRNQPPMLNVLANPGFELPATDGQAIPGWGGTNDSGAAVNLDADERHGGSRSLRISSQGPVATLMSEPFELPPTGRLTMYVWLRTDNAARQPPFQLALVGRHEGRDLFHRVLVGQSVGPQQPERSLGTTWELMTVEFALPFEALSPLQLRFDLLGAGNVWIDDIQLCHLAFRDDEWGKLMTLIAPVRWKLGQGQVGDCVALLESYWPRFLMAHVPQPPPAVARKSMPSQDPPRSTPRDPERTTGLWNRMRGLLPERFR
jgi:hypothetical protein